MKHNVEHRVRSRSELELISFARRFAPPDYPIDAPVIAGDLSDLDYWWGALAEAIEDVLPSNSDLWRKAMEASGDFDALIDLWESVMQLPERDQSFLVDHATNNRPLLKYDEPHTRPCGEWF